MGLVLISSVHSEEATGQVKTQEITKMKNEMEMDRISGMMKECMIIKKDGSACDRDTMEKCQKNMSREDCQALMSKAKSKTSTY
jgi:hypothetical protein